MPQEFDSCIKNGGKVRTIKVSGGKYMRVCFPVGGGSSVAGEVRTPARKQVSSIRTRKPIIEVPEMMNMMSQLDLRVRKMPWYGQTNGQYIKTNTKRGDVLNTIVHELMHVKYPRKTEEQIIALSRRIENNMSMRDQAKLLMDYESKVKRTGDLAIMYKRKK